MRDNILQLHGLDNVAIVLKGMPAGSHVDLYGEPCILSNDIPRGHKIALRAIAEGESVIKYGYPIGHATRRILAGEHVHCHNMATNLKGERDYAYAPALEPVHYRKPEIFYGYRRANGQVGVRNEIWIVPTVGCVCAVAEQICAEMQPETCGMVDGIYTFSHPYGCSQLGDDLLSTQKALCGLIRHPNAGGGLVLGLGCENNTMESLKVCLGEYDPERVQFLSMQETEDEVEAAKTILRRLLKRAAACIRTACPSSELTIGLKCGGSDGFSGITGNPLTGKIADRLIAEGGSAVLTEVPEMFGAETILLGRCVSEAVFDKAAHLINGYKAYFLSHGQPVGENPSPGNKTGGITTLEEKSLGCVQKAGHVPVEGVLEYGECCRKKGLSLLAAPGNDQVSASALAFSGAHLVLFTTGRGTPFGRPVPTIKISSNSDLAIHKRNWIDFDAGRLLNGESMECLADELFRLMLSVASGCRTLSEKLSVHGIAIFKNGVTL